MMCQWAPGFSFLPPLNPRDQVLEKLTTRRCQWVQKKRHPLQKKNSVLSSQQPGKRTAELSWPLQNGHTSATVHSSNVDASLSTFLFTYSNARLRDPGLPPSPRLSFLTHRSCYLEVSEFCRGSVPDTNSQCPPLYPAPHGASRHCPRRAPNASLLPVGPAAPSSLPVRGTPWSLGFASELFYVRGFHPMGPIPICPSRSINGLLSGSPPLGG